MSISIIVTGSGTINAVVNNKSYIVPRDHRNYDRIKEAIKKKDEALFIELADANAGLKNFSNGVVEVRDGQVYHKGKVLHMALTKHILMLQQHGHTFEPAAKMLEKTMQNPSMRSVNELFPFLERNNMPITEDGCFLGYKRVNDDYTDVYSSKIDNRVGAVIERLERNQVDDDWRVACSNGYHVGSIDYVRGFKAKDRKLGHVMIVKVDPADVISVPNGENKLRCCFYEIVGEYDNKLIDPMPETLHTSTGQPITGMGGYGTDTTSEVRREDFIDPEDDDDEDDSELDGSDLDSELDDDDDDDDELYDSDLDDDDDEDEDDDDDDL